MPNETTNYKLKKPLPEEFYDIGVHNANMDTIDAELKNHTHTAADVGARPNTWMPTAADVGAINKSGDTMNGVLTQLNGNFTTAYTATTTGPYITTWDANDNAVSLMFYNADQTLRIRQKPSGGSVRISELLHTGNKDLIFTYGTNDLTAGTSALETGKLYFVYE